MNQSWSQLDTSQPITAETIRDSRAIQLQSCRQRIALFKGLQVENDEDRSLALEKIIQVVKSYIRSTTLSPTSSTTSPNLSDSTTPAIVQQHSDIILVDDDYENIEYEAQLFYYLLTIVRLSVTCPFMDVRQTFRSFLKGLKESASIHIPEPRYKSPSYFISLSDIFSLETNSSSSQQTVMYPRSSHLSFSPWSVTTTSSVEDAVTLSNNQSRSHDFTGGRPSDEYVRQMMLKTFIDEGRLSNLYRVLSFFPTFFEIYHLTWTKTFKMPIGPLHRTWKSYIGLMVASEQQCQYLVSMMKLDFLYNGGDPNWLLGLDYIPHKLRLLSRWIVTMARQPWNNNDNDDAINEMEGWSKGELVQATLIIATTLGLSSFILGCGITPEIDMTGGSHASTGIECELDLPTIHLLKKSTSLYSTDDGVGLGVCTEQQGQPFSNDDHRAEKVTEELIAKLKEKKNSEIKEKILESFEGLNIQTTMKSSPPPEKEEEEEEEEEEANMLFEDLSRFVDSHLNEKIKVQDFETSGHMEFMLGEYCFEDHGCDLMNHYLPSLGDDLVAEFTEAISITDWSIFHPVAEEVVDTSPLRNAIWYYTQKLMGVTKEDYTYSDIPTYLNERTMKYIRDLCMSPHTIQANDWKNLGIKFRPEEKCHVNLLIASARKQAILCYGLNLVSEKL